MSAAQPTGDLFCRCGCGAWLGQCVRPYPRLYVYPAPLTGVFTLPPSTLMPNDQDPRETTLTTPAPPPSEPTTRTENDKPEQRDALAPPALPSVDDLGSTALASTEPPEWFKASFIGQALTGFANDAKAIREGRAQQHAELLAKLDEQGAKQDDAARLVLELGANLDLLTGEFKLFRDACEKRLAEGDERFRTIERKVTELETRFAKMLEHHMADMLQAAIQPFVTEFAEIRQLVADLKANVTARSTPTAPST